MLRRKRDAGALQRILEALRAARARSGSRAGRRSRPMRRWPSAIEMFSRCVHHARNRSRRPCARSGDPASPTPCGHSGCRSRRRARATISFSLIGRQQHDAVEALALEEVAHILEHGAEPRSSGRTISSNSVSRIASSMPCLHVHHHLRVRIVVDQADQVVAPQRQRAPGHWGHSPTR